MSNPPKYWKKAKQILSKKDLVLKKIIKQNRNAYLKTRNDPFFSICRTIIGQQISVKAADSIWTRFRIKCKKIVVSAVAGQTVSVCASLTGIEAKHMEQHDQGDYGTVA